MNQVLEFQATQLVKVCLFVTEEILCTIKQSMAHSSMSMDNTTQYHCRHLIKGVMPSHMLLVFLTPSEALSSHPTSTYGLTVLATG